MTATLIYDFDLEYDGRPPYPSKRDPYTRMCESLEAAGVAMMRGDIAYARHNCVEAAKLRDMNRTPAENAVLIAGYAERKAQREARQALPAPGLEGPPEYRDVYDEEWRDFRDSVGAGHPEEQIND